MSSASHRHADFARRPVLRAVTGTATATAIALAVAVGGPSYAAAPGAHETHRENTVLDASHDEAGRDPTRATGPGLYIVTLTGKPAAVYDGGLTGFRGTKPAPGKRFDRTRPAVAEYQQRLTDQQDRILAEIGDPQVVYRFTTALNGFAADLTSQQVKRLRDTDGVALVEKESTQHLDTVESPDFLGLEGPDGAWERHGGPDEAGAGTVVGVIDSGIWPENPSFAGVPSRSPGTSDDLPGFHGACQDGEGWHRTDCSEKVISARYFVEGFGKQNLAKAEYLSPRDGTGHGSHVAAVAAGNDAVSVEIAGQGFGDASGMAPAARIAAYKVCWAAPDPEDDGCSTADAVAAIDQAVADGVDVINYSLSGSSQTVADSVGLAFLNAAAAGVFVATSAGNRGPEPGMVSHPSPWVTTVAASTHQLFQGAVDLGDDTSYVGAMVADEAVPSTGLVLAEDAAGAGATPSEARLCEVGSLDASVVQDKIVVCDRGVIARVDKSAAVARAGGVGMVLVNVIPGSQDADFHAVPTVHVDGTEGRAIKEYVDEEGGDATASIDPSAADDTAVPQIAGFSSRGPVSAVGGDLLKPDLTAPGVGVVSAVAPSSNSGRLWDLSSGTSVSAAHVAGLAAFAQGVHPQWSPARIKSAMMTTAYDLDGTSDPTSQGAGHVAPAQFLDPGLVYDSDARDWLGFLRGQGFEYADGSAVSSARLEAGDLNVPSIAVGSLVGQTTLQRTVTNVSGSSESFSATVTGLNGVNATVSPDTLLLDPGESATFRVRLETDADAQMGTFTSGSLTWTGLTANDVRIPLTVRPEPVTAPDEVSVTGASGVKEISGRAAGAGPLELSTAGLVGALPAPVSLVPGSFDPVDPESDGDTLSTTIDVPEDTDVARFSMDADDSRDDLDLFVYLEGELVGMSATESADETVTLVGPDTGAYDVYVSAVSAADGGSTTGQLYTWVVSPADAGNVSLAPSQINTQAGGPFEFTATWDDLDLTQRWFGAVTYGDTHERTYLTVE